MSRNLDYEPIGGDDALIAAESSQSPARGRRVGLTGVREMLRRIAVMVTVGLADSLTPSTIGPALYMATGRRRVSRVAQFTVGFFAVNFVFGLALLIGPGRALLGLVPRPRGDVKHVIELVAGAF